MNALPQRWGLIATHFATFAAWIDSAGRLTRFNLSADGAADVDPHAVRDDAALGDLRRQVEQYCRGERQVFAIERAAQGSPFQIDVWNALMEIPFGATASYGQIARAVGRPQAARAVGAANHANPIALIVPCHRVIGADGSLTGYGGGLPLKQALLRHEAEVSGRTRGLLATG
jgi:methylated-DNA-[protein]-cysteine S-methyltransferase